MSVRVLTKIVIQPCVGGVTLVLWVFSSFAASKYK